jgi:hypothetical protein
MSDPTVRPLALAGDGRLSFDLDLYFLFIRGLQFIDVIAGKQ